MAIGMSNLLQSACHMIMQVLHHYFGLVTLDKCSVGGHCLQLLPPVIVSHVTYFMVCYCCHMLINISVSVHMVLCIVTRVVSIVTQV